MKKTVGIAVAFALLLSLVCLNGCKGMEGKLVGKYKGDINMPEAKKNDPTSAMAQGFAKMMAGSLSLELKSDKTFTMNMFLAIEGTWAVNGDEVVLTPTKFGGMSVSEAKAQAQKQPGALGKSSPQEMEKPMKMKISDNGNKLTAEDDKPGKGGLTFTKEK